LWTAAKECVGLCVAGIYLFFCARLISVFIQHQDDLTLWQFLLLGLMFSCFLTIGIAPIAVAFRHFATWLHPRGIPPVSIPSVPRIGDDDEPPGRAPIFAKLGPRKPAPLASHAVAVPKD